MAMQLFDVAIVGAGPAGLHAAWKAALLYRSAAIFDGNAELSRIYWAPRVANIPGRQGISGRELIRAAHEDIEAYESSVQRSLVSFYGEATGVERAGAGAARRFTITTDDGNVQARNLILATGAADRQPRLESFRRRDIETILPYANKGLADYCLLCDGHTVEGKRVAVLGCDPGTRGIAKSLKANFGAETVLVPYCNPQQKGEGPMDPQGPWKDVEADLAKWEIPIVFGEIASFSGIRDGRFQITFTDGRCEDFDKAWISMGWYEVRNALAKQLDADLDADGFVRTDADGRMLSGGAPLEGAYAVGDLRSGTWKQIPVAWGQAESAVIDCFVKTRRTERLS